MILKSISCWSVVFNQVMKSIENREFYIHPRWNILPRRAKEHGLPNHMSLTPESGFWKFCIHSGLIAAYRYWEKLGYIRLSFYDILNWNNKCDENCVQPKFSWNKFRGEKNSKTVLQIIDNVLYEHLWVMNYCLIW